MTHLGLLIVCSSLKVVKQVLDCISYRLQCYARITSVIGEKFTARYLDDDVLGYMFSIKCTAPS